MRHIIFSSYRANCDHDHFKGLSKRHDRAGEGSFKVKNEDKDSVACFYLILLPYALSCQCIGDYFNNFDSNAKLRMKIHVNVEKREMNKASLKISKMNFFFVAHLVHKNFSVF
jgi:hypothetical protein